MLKDKEEFMDGKKIFVERKSIIPRYVVCAGEAAEADRDHVDFMAIDIPVENAKSRQGGLMFSGADKARTFMRAQGGANKLHLRFLDYQILHNLLTVGGELKIDCIAIDFNTQKPSVVHCIDTAKIVQALGWQKWAVENSEEDEDGDPGDPVEVESWTVFL